VALKRGEMLSQEDESTMRLKRKQREPLEEEEGLIESERSQVACPVKKRLKTSKSDSVTSTGIPGMLDIPTVTMYSRFFGDSSSVRSLAIAAAAAQPVPENPSSQAQEESATIMVATGPVNSGQTRKRRPGRRWTAEEDAILRELVEKNGYRHWKKCAREFQEKSGIVRSDVQCLHRWNKCLRPGLVKGQWTPEEDRIICEMVEKNKGHENVRWSAIAKELKGRLGKQVRERWINHLDPSIIKTGWTAPEDEKLAQLHEKYGNRWKWIAELIPGRTENGVKNRWHSLKGSKKVRPQNKADENLGTKKSKTCTVPRSTKSTTQAA